MPGDKKNISGRIMQENAENKKYSSPTLPISALTANHKSDQGGLSYA